jgi:hypothetical protein
MQFGLPLYDALCSRGRSASVAHVAHGAAAAGLRLHAFDAELGHFQAAGQIISQTHQLIAFEATRGASRAAIAAMTNHRGYRTRPSTTPAHGRTAL